MPSCTSSLTLSLLPRPTLSIHLPAPNNALTVMDVDNGRPTTMVGIPSLPPTGTFTVPAHMTAMTIVPQNGSRSKPLKICQQPRPLTAFTASHTRTAACPSHATIADAGVTPHVSTLSKAQSRRSGDVGSVCRGQWTRRGWFFLPQQRQRQSYKMVSRMSPGVEKKLWRTSAPAIEGSSGHRKRSILTQHPNNHPHSQPTRTEEEPIDVCEPPSTSYVHISKDVVPNRGACQ
jgi:hypothetical protein